MPLISTKRVCRKKTISTNIIIRYKTIYNKHLKMGVAFKCSISYGYHFTRSYTAHNVIEMRLCLVSLSRMCVSYYDWIGIMQTSDEFEEVQYKNVNRLYSTECVDREKKIKIRKDGICISHLIINHLIKLSPMSDFLLEP